MKRSLFVFAVVLLAVEALAAAPLPREVRTVVLNALTNEREAIARYEQFARKADEEGYRGAAALFRAQARAERIHAQRFEAILRAEEVPLPAEQPATADVGSTAENLRAAAIAERSERDGIYRESIETCKATGATAVAKVFDQTRDSEVEHANLCNAAARDIESMKQPKTFYVCGKCGYTTDLKLPFCPACQHKHPLESVE